MDQGNNPEQGDANQGNAGANQGNANQPAAAANQPTAANQQQAMIAQLIAQNNILVNQLANIMNHIQQPAHHQPVIIVDLHQTGTAYNLAQRNGLAAFQEASAALLHKYDGSNSTYPNFLNALQQRAAKCFWTAVATSGGITTYGGKDLFTQINSITEQELRTAYAARTNDRAKQNSLALYECLSNSVSGNLYSNFFSQSGNLPAQRDGPLLFKAISKFTTINTMSSAVDTTDSLTNLDPAAYNFNIVLINQELNQLFVRTAQSPFGHIVNNPYKLFYSLKAYEKIKRPRDFHDFVVDLKRQYTTGTLTDPTILMSEATAKFNELRQFTGEYQASSSSLEESVVTMLSNLAAKQLKQTKKGSGDPDERKPKQSEGDDPKKTPPFLTHTRASAKSGGAEYKEGDTKVWNGTKYYFHVAESHKDGKQWFQHNPAKCITCNRFKDPDDKNKTNEDNDNSTASTAQVSDMSSMSEGSNDLESLLTRCYDEAETNPKAETLQAYIADCLSTLQE